MTKTRITTKRIDRPLRAVCFNVGNLVVMILISSLVKLLAQRYSVSQILFFRYAFAVIPLFVYMALTHGLPSMRSNRYQDHAIRTISGMLGLGLFFYAISLIPMAEATILAHASPIFIIVLSTPYWRRESAYVDGAPSLWGLLGRLLLFNQGRSYSVSVAWRRSDRIGIGCGLRFNLATADE